MKRASLICVLVLFSAVMAGAPPLARAACPTNYCAAERASCLAGCSCAYFSCNPVQCTSSCTCPIFCLD